MEKISQRGTSRLELLGRCYLGERIQGVWQVWGGGEMHTGFWWGNLKDRGHLKNLDADK